MPVLPEPRDQRDPLGRIASLLAPLAHLGDPLAPQGPRERQDQPEVLGVKGQLALRGRQVLERRGRLGAWGQPDPLLVVTF